MQQYSNQFRLGLHYFITLCSNEFCKTGDIKYYVNKFYHTQTELVPSRNILSQNLGHKILCEIFYYTQTEFVPSRNMVIQVFSHQRSGFWYYIVFVNVSHVS